MVNIVMTVLWRSLRSNYPDRTYFVQVTSEEENNESSGPPTYNFSEDAGERTISSIRTGFLVRLMFWSRGYNPLSLLCPNPERCSNVQRMGPRRISR